MVSLYGPQGLGFRVEVLWRCRILFLRGASKPGRQLKIPLYAQDFPEDHEGYPLPMCPLRHMVMEVQAAEFRVLGFCGSLGGIQVERLTL